MGEKIVTRHPDPAKRGRNIDRRNYEAVRTAVLATLRQRGEMTFEALRDEVERRLRGRFQGSVSWYYTTVKLDLEARKLLERVPRSRPQRVRLRGSQTASAGTGRPTAQRRVSSRRR
ncbi:MAG TPA: hypothetical protein VGR25_07050 [bacterium]|jgi:hypothetical protein|nr:hypothetical protein [bacterium]